MLVNSPTVVVVVVDLYVDHRASGFNKVQTSQVCDSRKNSGSRIHSNIRQNVVVSVRELTNSSCRCWHTVDCIYQLVKIYEFLQELHNILQLLQHHCCNSQFPCFAP